MKIDHLSHSSLSALKISPQYFVKYKNKELNKSNKGFDLGSAIHCYILEQDQFATRYIVADIPVVGGMMGIFLDAIIENEVFINSTVYDNTEDTPAEFVINSIDELYESCYKKAGFKTPLAGVIKKLEKEENQNYLDFLRKAKGKIILSADDYEIVQHCTASVASHAVAGNICNTSELNNSEAEKEISWTYKGYPYIIKSIIDNLILDKEKKLVTIVDLKTTAKSVYNFIGAYSSYGYYRQLAIYKLAVIAYLEKLGEDPLLYDLKSYIVTVQTTGLFECVVYEPDSLDLSIAIDEFESLLNRFKWHQDHNHWDYPMEYYNNNGVIKIKLSDDKISRIRETENIQAY
tara:strand:- start:2523 stop:3563 length:1041 start_codon:yes stop_codon:yes gene_type:complete